MAYTTVDKSSSYFNTVLYTGTGQSSGQSITGVGFQPDFLWIKSRSAAYQHSLRDVIRGSTITLRSNGTNAEETQSNSVTSFNSDGFTLGIDTSSFVNQSPDTYVAWNWKANGTGVSNTAGTITSTVSANTTSGFSVVSWTGAGAAGTVGHGLGAVPNFIITKKRNNTGNWGCYHVSLGNTKYIYLNSTSAPAVYSGYWNNTTPTSTLISLGTDDNVTGNNDNIIAYCFAEVKGFSKFGSYNGNSSTDGTFVYTGFKPAWVMIKNITNANNWIMLDNKRGPYNLQSTTLYPNTSDAETSTTTNFGMDFLSNGMKMRTSGDFNTNSNNASGNTYIYAAFAENPFVSATKIPTTAR